MKFLLKQLHLFFPFVFWMYAVGEGEYSPDVSEERTLLLEKRIAELKAHVKELEENNKGLVELIESLCRDFLCYMANQSSLKRRVEELEEKLTNEEERRKDPEKYFWTH